MKTNFREKLLSKTIPGLFITLLFVLTFGLFTAKDSQSQPVISVPAGNTAALINALNTANGNANTIINLGGGTYVLTAIDNDNQGDTGLPTITSTLTINGSNSTIMRSIAGGTPNFRIMAVQGTADQVVTLNNLTISNGDVTAGAGGGGIFNNGPGTINLNNVTVTRNSANGGGNGVENDEIGTININNSNIVDNDGPGRDGGVNNDRGGGTVNITDSNISDNDKTSSGLFGAGGVGNNSGGTVNITRTTISNNTNAHDRSTGGVWNNSGGILNISESLIINNRGFEGGGVTNQSNGTTNITNTTIKNNIGLKFGGGVYNDGTGDTNIDSCTISGNTSPSGPNINDDSSSSGQINIINTIVGDNLNDGNCNLSLDIISQGYNIDSGNSCNFNNIGDMVNTDPLLGPLGFNGGPTLTCALLPGSPAINTGNPNCPPPDTDQRGVPRPVDGRCDIGAFEGAPLIAAIPTLNEIGFIALAIALGLSAIFVIRKRQAQA